MPQFLSYAVMEVESVQFKAEFIMFSFFMLYELVIQEAGAGSGMH